MFSVLHFFANIAGHHGLEVKMDSFSIGQRWISDAEPDLGLGIIKEQDFRQVHLYFPSSDVLRSYAKASAPLTRVVFESGDSVQTTKGDFLKVVETEEDDGLIIYICSSEDDQNIVTVLETDLNSQLQYKSAADRLFGFQFDKPQWFHLRKQSLQALSNYQTQESRGLLGARIDLIRHQLYVAHSISIRANPRVLLADEVGLGKTIEAGLILHHQLVTERASRVLIVVPEVLTHQWLVEMIRRFNLHFSIYDDERCNLSEGNPFLEDQWIICSQEFLLQHSDHTNSAIDAGWDLLIVDEAHHIEWSENSPSEQYAILEKFTSSIPSLLLLTATPEQLGVDSHFARLRLIDPHRFSNLNTFIKEEEQYPELSEHIKPLVEHIPLTDEDYKNLLNWIDDNELMAELDPSKTQSIDQRDEFYPALLQTLIDRHGTSRVVFRNTRNTVQGFPGRKLHCYPLAPVNAYSTEDQTLYPEQLLIRNNEDWLTEDPRVHWLARFIKEQKNQKILVICAKSSTARMLADHLKLKEALPVSLFHEGMSLIERDRAAAYFAQPDSGASTLVCSEIGGEGRNFQFSSHLVLFDLPMSPDMLDQRIGRLDRIGQKNTINIHVPLIEGTIQEKLFDWFHNGLGIFEKLNSAASVVASHMQEQLDEVLFSTIESDEWQSFIEKTQHQNLEAKERLKQGRDRLLELSSCNETDSIKLVRSIRKFEENNFLQPIIEKFFDCYGIDYQDDVGDQCYTLRPGEDMLIEHFPGLPDEGMTFTYDRKTALSRDDVQFFSWEHPIVRHALEITTSMPHGNSSIATISGSQYIPGSLFIHCLYSPECIAPPKLQISRFLPSACIQQLIMNNGEFIDNQSFQGLELSAVDQQTSGELVKSQKQLLVELIEKCERKSEQELKNLVDQAQNKMLTEKTLEIKRLAELKKSNASIRDEEIDELKDETRALHKHLQTARLRLDAIQVIITV